MKSASELVVNNVYVVKHSSGLINARFLGAIQRGGSQSRNGFLTRRVRNHFLFRNLKTDRDIEIKSLVKVIHEVVS